MTYEQEINRCGRCDFFIISRWESDEIYEYSVQTECICPKCGKLMYIEGVA